MYVVTGASGQTGRTTTLHLLNQGHEVRAVGRTAERLADLADRGAQVHEADPSDVEALAAAFADAEGIYAVIQPNYIPDHPDFGAFQDRIAASITDAVVISGATRVVGLSRWGAQHATGTGPVKGLHRFEVRLSSVPGVDTLWLRAGYFMENLLGHADDVRNHGRVIAPFPPDAAMPFISTEDVGAAAARALTEQTWSGMQVRELQGERDVTMADVTKAIGAALDLPGLTYEQCSIAAFEEGLRSAGVSEDVASMMGEVGEAVNSGHLRMVQPRSPRRPRKPLSSASLRTCSGRTTTRPLSTATVLAVTAGQLSRWSGYGWGPCSCVPQLSGFSGVWRGIGAGQAVAPSAKGRKCLV
ncbi:NmrA family NAD(P)-binding protein, partial [Streptomyces rhizosphaericus]